MNERFSGNSRPVPGVPRVRAGGRIFYGGGVLAGGGGFRMTKTSKLGKILYKKKNGPNNVGSNGPLRPLGGLVGWYGPGTSTFG